MSRQSRISHHRTRPSRMFRALPPVGRGQRIGLYGGSFNPPHEGHRQIALQAMNRLKLDAVWWLVSPGNPLKHHHELGLLDKRMHDAANLAAHPRMPVSGVEAAWNIRYTADLVQKLNRRNRTARFVWIMGSDNLANFHHWERWQTIISSLPIVVVNRPGTLTAPLSAPAAHAFAQYRLNAGSAGKIALFPPPAWIFLVGPRTAASSTAIRRRKR